MQRTKWTERTFQFDFPEGWLPNIMERLRGTVPRISYMVAPAEEDMLGSRVGEKWSVKEHIGHLVDLEDLHINRLNEMLEKKPELSAADMSNQKTEEANHNEAGISALLKGLDQKRTIFLEILDAMDDDIQMHKALHPRLNIYMRPIDVAYFTAEHDDHHLASMRELLKYENHAGR